MLQNIEKLGRVKIISDSQQHYSLNCHLVLDTVIYNYESNNDNEEAPMLVF